MTEKLQQIIKNEVEKLPKEAREAINAFDWTKVVEEIGKKYLLDESEINNFQVETLLLLVGIEDENYYAQNIENKAGTSKNEAEKIAEEVLQKIFTPINDILVEKIKKSDKNKNPNWQQNLNFILSGGDYSAFMERISENSPLSKPSPSLYDGEGRKGNDISAAKQETNKKEPIPPTLAEIQNNAQKTVLPVFSIKKET